MFRTVLMLAAVLTLAPAAFAGSPELPAVEKKVKAKKLDKLLLGEWRIYPASDPELSKWLSGMSSLDMSIDEIATMYRLSDRLKGRLELERAKKPPVLPPQLQAMLRDGVMVKFDEAGNMSGAFGGESMGGTYEIIVRENNRLEVNTKPEEGREDIIVMHWIDADRMVWSNQDDKGSQLNAVRIEK